MAFFDIDNVVYREGKDGRVFILHPRYRFDPIVTPLLVAGTAMSAYGTYQEGQAASAEAKYNAQMKEREAKAIEQRTAVQQQRQAEEADRRRGAMAAQLGASGAVTSAGSPLMLMAEQRAQDSLESMMIGYEGREQALGARQAGAMYKMQAKSAKQAGIIGAGSTLLHGFGQAYTPQNQDYKLAKKHGIM